MPGVTKVIVLSIIWLRQTYPPMSQHSCDPKRRSKRLNTSALSRTAGVPPLNLN